MLIPISFCQRAIAHPEEEISLLRMYYSEKELVVTPSRQLKPISQVAENITVITLDEIEAMNAHTLTDVLKSIPGLQFDIKGGPGAGGNLYIQGSEFNHVLLVIDGVILNHLGNGFADLSVLPVQNIGRIEIIKGPASSTWGSSLGGVINIITKPVGGRNKPSGSIIQSGGEKKTLDSRVEVYEQHKNFGYYLFAGNLFSNGLQPANSVEKKNLYTKLHWDAGEKASLVFTFGLNTGTIEELKSYEYIKDIADFRYILYGKDLANLFSTLCLHYLITNKLDIKLSFRTSRHNTEPFENFFNTGKEYGRSITEESLYGGSALLRGKNGRNNWTLGTDYEMGELKSNVILGGKQKLEKKAVFVNDTILVDTFSFIPGIRYDHIGAHDKFLSPSFGLAWSLKKGTILRLYMANGFNSIPLDVMYLDSPFLVLNHDLEVEKVRSIQAGIESSVLKYLWFKTSLFRHSIRDSLEYAPWSEDPSKFTWINKKKQKRQGLELEIKTASVYNTSFLAGLAIVSAKNEDTGKRLNYIPRYTYDLGIQYLDKKTFQASLKGHYIRWDTSYCNGSNNFTWDIALTKKIHEKMGKSVEAFLTVRNIFDGQQYLIECYKPPGRWLEAGLRCKF